MDELKNLFTPMSRDERQHEAVNKWIATKGHATVVAATGVGKTHIAIKAIKRLRARYPDLDVLVLVPTSALKQQWLDTLEEQGVKEHTRVKVMMGASKRTDECGLLVIDEAHRVSSEVLCNVFKVIKYKCILGLTATFERLDGRDRILAKYAPVCDEIPMHVALANGWVSKYKDYIVILEVDDIDKYKAYNKEFIEHFGFFGFEWDTVMGLVGKDGFKKRKAYTSSICTNPQEWSNVFKQVTYHSVGLMHTLKARKSFIADHPDKVRVAQKIIDKRKDKKIITFCPNVKVAESFGNGFVFTGKNSKKQNRITMEEFMQKSDGILHTCQLCNEGVSVGDLAVGIMLGVNSSKTKQVQTLTAI